MSAEGLGRTIIWVAIVLVVIIILAIVVLKLLAYLVIAPYAFATNDIAPQAGEGDPDNMVGKETIDIGNDTKLHITCTENIEGLVEDCG